MSKEKKLSEIKFPSLEELLKAGVHFGHQTRRWHPGMAPYIFATKKGIHIFDLQKTLELLKVAAEKLRRIASEGGVIIFVGTKRQAKPIVEAIAKKCGAMYVTERWLGGTITNFESIKVNLRKLKEIKEGLARGDYADRTKKERLILGREANRLEKLVGGISNLEGLPAALFIVDPRREKTAVREAEKKGVLRAAIVDTNCEPSLIDYVIPGNDDSSKSIKIILETIGEAIRSGYERSGPKAEKRPEKSAPAESVAALGLSTRSLNALTKAGIKTVAELKGMGEEKLLKIKGLGKKSVTEIFDKME